jgi:hypothetical protein
MTDILIPPPKAFLIDQKSLFASSYSFIFAKFGLKKQPANPQSGKGLGDFF